MRPSIRSEFLPMLNIAVPVVMAELGWMTMGVVDTAMVGPLGPQAISAAGVGTAMHMGFTVFGMGLLLGLDTLVSQAFGRRDIRDCHRWLFDGLTLAAIMAIPVMAVCGVVWWAIPSLGFYPEVKPLLRAYFGIVVLSTPFLLLYAACRRYLQGMHVVTPLMFALVTANLINAGLNWVFIYGHLGLPAMGVSGSALATLFARIYMLGVLVIAVWWYDKQRTGESLWNVDRGFDRGRLTRLLKLGLPAASQVAAEVGVFVLATALSGTLDPISSAAHQIALNMSGVAFMIPLGLSSAGAVRVGHAVGSGDRARAAAAGWTAILLVVMVMVVSGLTFILVPEHLIGAFSSNELVLSVGASLLFLAAVFQLFDGIQVVITGTLRGLGDTRTAMIVTLIAHWLLGLPVSYVLCFVLGWGVWGLWIGLTLGLIVAGVILFSIWTMKIRHYQVAA
ncbi:MAG TPA: MATE family efflux transporter [Vicinamibacterales bacterium]